MANQTQGCPPARAWVRYELAKKGRTLAGVAAEAGVGTSTIYSAFRKPYPRMEWLIASAVGVAPSAIWPERYGLDGLPNRKPGRPANSTPYNASYVRTPDCVERSA